MKGFIWAPLLFCVVGTGVLGGVVAAYVRDLPPLDILEEYQPSLITTLYDDQGKPFASFYEQRRILVPLDKIPRFLRDAVIAVEDSRFYQHYGLDPVGITRALWSNLNCLCLAEGGSTITQQLAKVLFFTPEKSISRKFKEALLVLRIERELPKDKILELYFNQVYFGHGAYGIQAAAQTYFNKSVHELNLAEAAMLAGLPKAPNFYSPILDPKRARRRRRHVLQRMAQEGFITAEQAQAATKLPFTIATFAKGNNLAPYFVEYVRQYLEDKFGTYAVYHSGLRVYTMLNVKMQEAAVLAIRRGLQDLAKRKRVTLKISLQSKGSPASQPPKVGESLEATVTGVTADLLQLQVREHRGEVPFEEFTKLGLPDMQARVKLGDQIPVRVVKRDGKRIEVAFEPEPEIQGAFLALDPRQGAIKAMVGGYDFQRSKFNRAIQARRQPGSAFKPIVYATAFDTGLTPATILEDTPVSYPMIIDDEITEWSPDNYDKSFRGPVTLRQGLEKSINIVAVKLIEQIGVNPVIRMARRLGIKSTLRPEYGLALGASEVSLLEMVSAYGVFAAGGHRAEPYAIKKVLDSKGVILEEWFPEPQLVLRPETAFVLTHVLQGVVERGTGKRAKVLKRPIAAKTGTTDKATDVWFIGYTPSLVAGVWIGYDIKRSLGPYATSSQLAVPIWINFARTGLQGAPIEYFQVPEGVVPMLANYRTGDPTTPDDPDAIQEYFIEGTEPEPIPVPGYQPLEFETRRDEPSRPAKIARPRKPSLETPSRTTSQPPMIYQPR
ncbi:MAG: penicillin-binding protein 1A [Candidatus Methylomirabilales bacterium]